MFAVYYGARCHEYGRGYSLIEAARIVEELRAEMPDREVWFEEV